MMGRSILQNGNSSQDIQGSYHSQMGGKNNSDIKHNHLRRKKIVAGTIVLLLILTAYIAIGYYIRTVLDDSDITFETIRILGSSNDTLELEFEAVVYNPSISRARLDGSTLEINFNGEGAGTISLPELELGSGNNHITIRTEMQARDGQINVLQNLTDRLLTSKNVTVDVKGDIQLKGLLPMTIPFEKSITLTTLGDLEIAIKNVKILESLDNVIRGEVEVLIDNPSIVETVLKGLKFDVYHEGVNIATIGTDGFLGKGRSNVNFSFDLMERDIENVQSLISAIRNGEAYLLEIEANATGGSLLSLMTGNYSYSYIDNTGSIASIDDIVFDVSTISLTKTDDIGISMEARVSILNPSIVITRLDGLVFELIYDGLFLADIPLKGFLEPGLNILDLSFVIPAEASAAYNSLIDAILEGENCSFIIQGKSTKDNLLSQLASGFSFNYSFTFSGGVDTSVTGFSIRSIGLFQTSIEAIALVNNPTPVQADLSNFEFNAYYQGNYLGRLDLGGTVIVTGEQTIGIFLTVSTISLQNIGLLTRLLTGDEVEILVEGVHEFDSGNVLRFYLVTTV